MIIFWMAGFYTILVFLLQLQPFPEF